MVKEANIRDEKSWPRQAAVIPVRRVAGGTVQVCLIRKKTSARWGIPKGYIERGDDWSDAALREAHEEAGLDGRVLGEIVGTYEYDKGLVDSHGACVRDGSARSANDMARNAVAGAALVLNRRTGRTPQRPSLVALVRSRPTKSGCDVA